MNPKYRNVIAEIVTVAGIMLAVISAEPSVHLTPWVGLALVALSNIGNQILKQFFPGPVTLTTVVPAAATPLASGTISPTPAAVPTFPVLPHQ